jgi:hypothetical protein
MKKCNKCNKEKEFNNFYKKKTASDGYSNICIECRKEYNKEKKVDIQTYYLENKEQYQNNSKKYYQNNKDIVKQNVNIWQKSNPFLVKDYLKKWNYNNREYFKKWRNNKYNTDLNFKLRIILGNRLNECLKKSKTNKNSNIISLLGCTLEECKLYLEKQFLPEMNWDNQGTIWEIDHITPCSLFNLTKEEKQKECFHITNLQPLFKTTEIAESFGYKDYIGNRNKNSKIL